jgi:plasmid stabilization system protein ParE
VKTFSVVFTPEAEEQLLSLYRYIAMHESPAVATKYTDAIVAYCETLSAFPHRGTCRDDVRPGLRITNYKRRTVIAVEVDEAAAQVAIIGVFYGGRDYESALGTDVDWDE